MKTNMKPTMCAPGAGWKHIAGAVWEHTTGTRIHLLGMARMPNGEWVSSNKWPESKVADFMIRANGGNRRRGLMAWSLMHNAHVSLPPCPFCGMPVDLEDQDTLYSSGIGWKFDDELQMRTYHRLADVLPEQWCYGMHCPESAGGCGAEIHGDSKEEALEKWSKRANIKLTGGASAEIGKEP